MSTHAQPQPHPMVLEFPAPGGLVRHAYHELHIAIHGTEEEQKALGNKALLPRPWEPASCRDPELRHQIWQWLDDVVIWLNREYTWDVHALIPRCWPHHPHLIHEIAVVADQRRRAGLALTSEALEEWHRYCLPAFIDRMRTRLRSGCEDDHKPWPGRPRHSEHTAEPDTQRREDAYARDLDTLPTRRRRGKPQPRQEPPRLVSVDIDTGELHDE